MEIRIRESRFIIIADCRHSSVLFMPISHVSPSHSIEIDYDFSSLLLLFSIYVPLILCLNIHVLIWLNSKTYYFMNHNFKVS